MPSHRRHLHQITLGRSSDLRTKLAKPSRLLSIRNKSMACQRRHVLFVRSQRRGRLGIAPKFPFHQTADNGFGHPSDVGGKLSDSVDHVHYASPKNKARANSGLSNLFLSRRNITTRFLKSSLWCTSGDDQCGGEHSYDDETSG